jgi:hypothetical protein
MSTSAAASAFGWSRRPRSCGNMESNFAGWLAAGERAGRRNRRRCCDRVSAHAFVFLRGHCPALASGICRGRPPSRKATHHTGTSLRRHSSRYPRRAAPVSGGAGSGDAAGRGIAASEWRAIRPGRAPRTRAARRGTPPRRADGAGTPPRWLALRSRLPLPPRPCGGWSIVLGVTVRPTDRTGRGERNRAPTRSRCNVALQLPEQAFSVGWQQSHR